jgi:hypothetical protein
MEQMTGARPSLDIVKTATDSLMLPVRIPILVAPFFLTTLLAAVLLLSVIIAIVINPPKASEYALQHITNILTAAVAIVLASVLAAEMTVELTARAELGRDMSLAPTFSHVLRRFPITLGATVVVAVGIAVGTILLIIPGLIVMFRWMLAPTAVLLGVRGVREALALSWQLTGAYFWPFTGLLLLVAVGAGALSALLAFIPVIGQLVAAWLSFAWAAIAMTLAYLRLGGPTDLS